MMKLPCEKALWYVLPQIRADLSKELVEQGMKQKDVAEYLGVTPSAVSQYMKRKRGGKIKTGEGYDKMLKTAAESIIDDNTPENVSTKICGCCQRIVRDMESNEEMK